MSLKFVKIVFLLNEISEILHTLRLTHRQRIDLGPDYISCSHSNFPPNKQVSVGSVSAVTAVTPVHRLRLLLTSQHLQRPARSVPPPAPPPATIIQLPDKFLTILTPVIEIRNRQEGMTSEVSRDLFQLENLICL